MCSYKDVCSHWFPSLRGWFLVFRAFRIRNVTNCPFNMWFHLFQLKGKNAVEFLIQYDTESIINDWHKVLMDTIRQLVSTSNVQWSISENDQGLRLHGQKYLGYWPRSELDIILIIVLKWVANNIFHSYSDASCSVNLSEYKFITLINCVVVGYPQARNLCVSVAVCGVSVCSSTGLKPVQVRFVNWDDC